MMTDTLVEADGDMAGVPVTDRGPWMQCPEGRIFYPLDPRPEEVFIDDIALGLSRQPRYNGLSDEVICVAQHSSQAAWIASMAGESVEVQFAMLMHDASEFVVGDMIRPVKCQMPEFKPIENGVQNAICIRFNVPDMNTLLQKKYDNLAWAWEKRDLFKSAREWPYTPELPDGLPRMRSWSQHYAFDRFLADFNNLSARQYNKDEPADEWPQFTESRDWRDV